MSRTNSNVNIQIGNQFECSHFILYALEKLTKIGFIYVKNKIQVINPYLITFKTFTME